MELNFEITITSCENYTWQGILATKQEIVPFQSEIELLLEMARQAGPEFENLSEPGWNRT